MKKIKLYTVMLLAAALGVAIMLPVATAGAIDPLAGVCSTNPSDPICKASGTDDATSLVDTIVNTLLFIVGILSVIMIIWSGIQYVISAGNSSKLTQAKNTLLYSIIGLVISLMAFAIVNWVIKLL